MRLVLAIMWMALHPAAVSSFAAWLAGWSVAGFALVIGGGLALLVAVVVLTHLAQSHSDSLATIFLTVFIVAVVMALISALIQWTGS